MGEPLGQVAVQRGLLTEQQLRECTEDVRLMQARGMKNASLARVLLWRNYVSQDQLKKLLTLKQALTGEAPRVAHFEIIGKAGEGGMGMVYKAKDTRTGRIVALKLLPPQLSRDEEFIKRFSREARVLIGLQHENIVGGIEFGEAPRGGMSVKYFAMEFVEGETLGRMIDRRGAIPWKQATKWTMDVALALDHAFEKGLVHRDVKPENVFITPDGKAKLGDFGLARSAAEFTTRLTATGLYVGSAHYSSPEQARGVRNLDVTSDIYSLGATFYHMVTGAPPFEGASGPAVLVKHISEEIPYPSDVNPDVPEQVSEIIARMMAKTPADRYASASGLVADLERTLRGSSPSKRLEGPVKSSVVRSGEERKVVLDAYRKRARVRRRRKATTARGTSPVRPDVWGWFAVGVCAATVVLLAAIGQITAAVLLLFLGALGAVIYFAAAATRAKARPARAREPVPAPAPAPAPAPIPAPMPTPLRAPVRPKPVVMEAKPVETPEAFALLGRVASSTVAEMVVDLRGKSYHVGRMGSAVAYMRAAAKQKEIDPALACYVAGGALFAGDESLEALFLRASAEELLQGTEKDVSLAVEVLRQVLSRYAGVRSEAASARACLGKGLMRLGRKEEAAQEFKRCLEEYPDQSTAASVAREALRALGLEKKAKKVPPVPRLVLETGARSLGRWGPEDASWKDVERRNGHTELKADETGLLAVKGTLSFGKDAGFLVGTETRVALDVWVEGADSITLVAYAIRGEELLYGVQSAEVATAEWARAQFRFAEMEMPAGSFEPGFRVYQLDVYCGEEEGVKCLVGEVAALDPPGAPAVRIQEKAPEVPEEKAAEKERELEAVAERKRFLDDLKPILKENRDYPLARSLATKWSETADEGNRGFFRGTAEAASLLETFMQRAEENSATAEGRRIPFMDKLGEVVSGGEGAVAIRVGKMELKAQVRTLEPNAVVALFDMDTGMAPEKAALARGLFLMAEDKHAAARDHLQVAKTLGADITGFV